MKRKVNLTLRKNAQRIFKDWDKPLPPSIPLIINRVETQESIQESEKLLAEIKEIAEKHHRIEQDTFKIKRLEDQMNHLKLIWNNFEKSKSI